MLAIIVSYFTVGLLYCLLGNKKKFNKTHLDYASTFFFIPTFIVLGLFAYIILYIKNMSKFITTISRH